MSEPSAASMPRTRCGATPETGQSDDCPECQGIVESIREPVGSDPRRMDYAYIPTFYDGAPRG